MNGKLNLGISGFGGFGQNLSKQFQSIDQVNIVGVFDHVESARNIAKEQGFQTYDSLEKLLDVKELDALAIASANIAHEKECLLALKAKKHIFIEKPVALNLESYDEILKQAKITNVVTHIDFTFRFQEDVTKLIQLVRSGEIGDPLSFYVNITRGFGLWSAGKRHNAIAHPEISGGWNIHHNIHGLDILLQMAGSKVVQVYAKNLRSTNDAPSEEINLGLLTFEGGGVGFIGDSISIMPGREFRCIGSLGTVLLREDKMVLQKEDGAIKMFEVSKLKNLRGSLLAFVQAALDLGNDNISLEEGRHSLEVSCAMNKSSDESRIIQL